MTVTGIENMTKTRSKVFLDGEFAFVLYKGELRHFQIEIGKELGAKAYDQIYEEILPKRAKLRAMNLLLKKDYTTVKLREKLEEGCYPKHVVDEALAYVESFHYTDDLRYAMDYITCHQDGKSRRRLEQDLIARGISSEILEKAWEGWQEAGGEQNEKEMIAGLLKKRGYDAENASPAERQKQYAFLMRKGFSADQVRKAVFGRFDVWED